MLFRFTLNNTIEGSHVISDPDGWKEIKLKLERDKEYHSLVEMVELPLRFYRTNDNVDGGYDYITNIEQTQGIDALIELLIEVSEDNGVTYETFFNGLIEITTIKDISDAESYIIECNIVRNDFWSKFFNRKSQQVDISGSVSLDGEALTPLPNVDIDLPSQSINQEYSAIISESVYLQWENTQDFIQVGFDQVTLDEVQTRFETPTAVNTSLPVWIFEILYDGTYQIDYSIETSVLTPLLVPPFVNFTIEAGSVYMEFKIQINDETPILFTEANFANSGDESDPSFTRFTYSDLHTLKVGDIIRIYAEGSVPFTMFALIWGETAITIPVYPVTVNIPTSSTGSSASIQANTTYIDTTTEAFLLRDAAESILTKIISRNNVLYSDYLGENTPSGCAAKYAITKGLHIRGYTMADKPMTMSFDDWWDGANPIFNLGLGYEEILGAEYIRIEDKGYFYDDDYSITFSNVDKITRSYDKDKIFKSIEIGYQKWSAESASGVDDPQTKHTYNTRFKIIGKDEKILSKFFAGSLGIEQTRRNRVEFGTDWRLDEDTIILALSDSYTIELDDDFTPITNLLNSDTRYNIRITPARNFERWKPFFNGCLQLYIPETYDFASGEGNYDMTSTGADTCDNGYLAENQDISVTTNFYHGPGVYEMEVPMSWSDYKTIRDNRNKSIRVSNTTSNYKLCKIDQMEYDHFNSIGEFTVWIKE